MRAAIAFTTLAACAGGVYVEVDTTGLPERAATVELVTTKKPCFDNDLPCRRIRGPDFGQFVEADMFIRGISGRAEVVDGIAAFELEPGSGVVPLAFAIARDADDVAVGAAVLEIGLDTDAGTLVYQARLDPVADLLANQRPLQAAGFLEWGDEQRCIGIEPLSPDPSRGKIFIVPDGNFDCDAIANDPMECDPFFFDAVLENDDGPHCAMFSELLPTTCVLGHIVCSEVSGDSGRECFEQRPPPDLDVPLCLPTQLCAGGSLDCDTFDEVCLEAALRGARPITPTITCDALGTSAGSEVVDACPTVPMTLARPVGLASATCTNVYLTASDAPFHAMPHLAFTSGMATFRIETVDPNCNVSLTWTGSLLTTVAPEGTTLVYEVDTGSVTRKLMFPLRFTAEPGTCAELGTTCAFAANNDTNIFKCAD